MTITAVNDTYVFLGRSGETLAAAGVFVVAPTDRATTPGAAMATSGYYLAGGAITARGSGQVANFITDAYGNQRVLPSYISSSATNQTMSVGLSQANTQGAQSTNVPSSAPYIYNGGSLDIQRKANVYSRFASSAASGNPAFAKASAGDVLEFWGLNTTAALRYLHLYNKASAPTIGTDTPVLSFPISANERFSVQMPNGGAYFNTGIAYAFTTDIATIPITGAAAGDITSFALLAA